MPVKTEQQSLLASVFESDQNAMEPSAVSSPCEDIWKKFDDFLLTPPQSPPIKALCGSDTDLGAFDSLLDVDFSSALDGFLEASLTDSTLAEVLNTYGPPDVDVLHDCMWSGQGLEDAHLGATSTAATNASPAIAARGYGLRAETPLLGTSPLSMAAFGDMLATCHDMDVAPETMDTQSLDEDDSSSASQTSASSGFVSSNESLINDHSYGSPKPLVRPASESTSSKQSQSLIYPSPVNYRKVLTRTRNGIKPKKVDKEYNPIAAQQVSLKFVKRSSSALKESTVSYSKKPVGKVNSTKKSLGALGLKPISYTTTIASSQSSSAVASSTSKHHNISSSYSPLSSCSSSRSSTSSSSSISSSRKVTSFKSSSHANGSNSNGKSKPMYPERRREHNDSERKRRDHLRDAFHTLRDQVPKLKETQKKPARITILHEASSYVGQLIEKHRYLESTKEAEMRKREKLLKKLADLRSQV